MQNEMKMKYFRSVKKKCVFCKIGGGASCPHVPVDPPQHGTLSLVLIIKP